MCVGVILQLKVFPGGAYYCYYKEKTSPLLLQSSVSFNRPYNTLGIAPCRIYEIHNAFFVCISKLFYA